MQTTSVGAGRAGTSDARTIERYFDAQGREVSSVDNIANGLSIASSLSSDAATGRRSTRTFTTGT